MSNLPSFKTLVISNLVVLVGVVAFIYVQNNPSIVDDFSVSNVSEAAVIPVEKAINQLENTSCNDYLGIKSKSKENLFQQKGNNLECQTITSDGIGVHISLAKYAGSVISTEEMANLRINYREQNLSSLVEEGEIIYFWYDFGESKLPVIDCNTTILSPLQEFEYIKIDYLTGGQNCQELEQLNRDLTYNLLAELSLGFEEVYTDLYINVSLLLDQRGQFELRDSYQTYINSLVRQEFKDARK